MSLRKPLEIPVYKHVAGRKLLDLMVEADATLSTFDKLIDVLTELKVDIYSATIVRRGDLRSFEAFIDITESPLTLEELKKRVQSIPGVKRIEVAEEKLPGLAVRSFSYPLVIEEQPVVLIEQPIWAGFIQEFKRTYGSGALSILYHVGYQGGVVQARRWKPFIKDDPRRGIEALLLIAKAMGWGDIQLDEFSGKRIAVKVFDCPECAFLRGVAKTPQNQMLRGFLSGLFSEIFGWEVTFSEERCIAKGDQYCLFVHEMKEPSKRQPS